MGEGMSKLQVKKIECDVLIHRGAMEPTSVHVTNARVTVLWHMTTRAYLAQLDVGMTVEELGLYRQLTGMITDRLEKELEQ